MSLRSLYYRLPVRLRYAARRIYYLPADVFHPLGEAYPPRGLIYTGGSGAAFAQQGREIRDFLLAHDLLDARSRVLDIGSGIGRIAIPLTAVVTEGRYEGFEVVRLGVDWCRRHVQSQHPHFNFRYVDLHNDLYKAAGADASAYTFPYPDGAFTLAIANSVFSHMVPAELVRYLGEAARVLVSGGRFYFTCFVLDEASEAAMERSDGLRFSEDRGYYRLLTARVESANVAYDRAYLEREIAASGLEIEHYYRGAWSGLAAGHPIAFQDNYVVRKGGG